MRATILLVEDDADSRSIYRTILEYVDFRVLEAGDAETGLHIARTERPDLVLMDIGLPSMDGWEATRLLKEDPDTAKIVVVALTAHARVADQQRAKSLGFEHFLAKPVTPRHVLAEVQRILGLTGATAELDSEQNDARDAFEATVRDVGLHAALGMLNSRTTHRFTGVYRFDPPTLRNLLLFDREAPDEQTGADAPMEETYCSIVGAIGAPFRSGDAGTDSRLTEHPAREAVISYCGVLLRTADGEPYGTLCHFDLVPRGIPEREIPLLSTLAPLVVQALAPA